ncbi:MAG TPA: FAD-binding protein [Candidatus Pelethocola excrementipullorum]|nr:FAD-binding protein [Candidatus Pelethocola excrementipullorum]
MNKQYIEIDGNEYLLYTHQTIIIGSGAAGLNAAVSLYKEGQKDVAIITEGKRMGTSLNTGSDKQTYYKMTTCGSEPDSVRQMAETLFSGGAMDGDLALAEAALSLRSFYHLVDIGVPFPHNAAGEYVGYKTDHDPNKRGTSAGPLTSKYMTEALWNEVERFRIPIYNSCQVIELLTEIQENGKRIRGVVALKVNETELAQQYVVFSAENIVYATGGEAGMYETSVYPVSQMGGMGAALRAGAIGKNLTESQYGIASIKFRWNLSGTYQQVIPRYVSTEIDGSDETEFLNDYFERPEDLLYAIFLKGYQWPFDPRKVKDYGSSLIDILVYQEMNLKGRRVFLDFQKNPAIADDKGRLNRKILKSETYNYLKNSGGLQDKPIERLLHMNPAAFELFMNHGIDLRCEMLEIAVCAQHNNGGLAGNSWWESNIKHLFPVGEVNGTHGVYRPGGSALNSGQVGSLRAAQFISKKYIEQPVATEQFLQICRAQISSAIQFGKNALNRKGPLLDLKRERSDLGSRMSRYAAHIRQKSGIAIAKSENAAQLDRVIHSGIEKVFELKRYYRLRDLLVSQAVYLEAIENYIDKGGRSRGSYLIADATGEKSLSNLPGEFRFWLEEGISTQIQEIEYSQEKMTISWRRVRPIPDEDNWFEKVWKCYREDSYFEDKVVSQIDC